MRKRKESKSKQSSASPVHLAALGMVILISLALRLHQLGEDSLWVDEIGQVYVAGLSLPEVVLGAMKHHGATPLDYLILHFWVMAGTGDFWVRVPAALYGTLTVALTYKLGRTLFGRSTGLVAAYLLSVSVFHIRYSQEVRFYALVTLLATLVLLTFIRAASSNQIGTWLAYFAAALAGLYGYYFIAIIIGLQFAALLIGGIVFRDSTIDSTAIWRMTAGLCVVGLLFMPWVLYDVPRQTGHAFGPPQLSLGVAVDIASNLTGFGAFGLGWCLFLGAFAIGAIRILHNIRHGFFSALLLSIAVLALGMILGIDSLFSYFFATRQILFILPVILLTASYGITWIPILLNDLVARSVHLRQESKSLKSVGGRESEKPPSSIGSGSTVGLVLRRWLGCAGRMVGGNKKASRRAGILMIVLLSMLVGYGNLSRLSAYYAGSKEDWRSVARFFQANLHPDDKITSPLLLFVGHYYPTAREHEVAVARSIEYDEINDALGEITRLWTISAPQYPHVDLGEDFTQWMYDTFGGYWEFRISSFRISYTGPEVCQHKAPETLGVAITADVQSVTRHCEE